MFWFSFSTDTACQTDYWWFYLLTEQESWLIAAVYAHVVITHFIVKSLEYLCLFWQTPPSRKPRILDKRQKKTPVHTFSCPFLSSFVGRHRRTRAGAWLRTPRGSVEGRECVYYNTFTPYTMFSLWAWLSPVGRSRSQPLLSLILWGLINQSR